VILAAKEPRRIIPFTMSIEDPEQEQKRTNTADYREVTMIGRYRDLPEALLARTSLESAGIECFLADENIVRMDWFWSNLLGGVKLLVHNEDAEAAVQILEAPAPEVFDAGGIPYERPRCPECNSLEIHFEEFTPFAYVSTYLGVPIPLHRKGWRCHSCGHEWQIEHGPDS
jgi:putative signal transducing protein